MGGWWTSILVSSPSMINSRLGASVCGWAFVLLGCPVQGPQHMLTCTGNDMVTATALRLT
eukprot:4714982-Pyramimonas_sp.AAC.1